MNEISITVYVSVTIFNILLFYILAALIRINILYILPLFIVIQSIASVLFAAYFVNGNGNELVNGTSGDGLLYTANNKWTPVHPSPHGSSLTVSGFNPPGDGEIFMNSTVIIMNQNTVGLQTFSPKDVLYFVDSNNNVKSYAITKVNLPDAHNSIVLEYEIYSDTC
jgi:hypothetical protein